MDTATPTADQKIEFMLTFLPWAEREAIKQGLMGEERAHFAGVIAEYTARTLAMPKTYEQDGKGDQAVVYLHYFTGGCDWWITERDMEEEQHQAFGLADLGHGAEMGYISIVELTHGGAELDLYFEPRTLAELAAQRTPQRPTCENCGNVKGECTCL